MENRIIVNPENVETIKASACKRIFKVGKYTLKMYIITGGTPALSLENYAFTERFPVIPKYSNENWNSARGLYTHQTSQSDSIDFDVLPEGYATVERYLNENAPKWEKRRARFDGLPLTGYVQSYSCFGMLKEIVSPTRLDKVDRKMYHFRWSLVEHYLPLVHFESTTSCSNENECFERLATPWWKSFNALIDSFGTLVGGLESITENQYTELCKCLKMGIASSDIAPTKTRK